MVGLRTLYMSEYTYMAWEDFGSRAGEPRGDDRDRLGDEAYPLGAPQGLGIA